MKSSVYQNFVLSFCNISFWRSRSYRQFPEISRHPHLPPIIVLNSFSREHNFCQKSYVLPTWPLRLCFMFEYPITPVIWCFERNRHRKRKSSADVYDYHMKQKSFIISMVCNPIISTIDQEIPFILPGQTVCKKIQNPEEPCRLCERTKKDEVCIPFEDTKHDWQQI